MKKILLIEDSKHIINQLSTVLQLENEEYEISCAEDGQSGLELARRIRPDIILLDIMLPKLSGIEVCRALKHDKRYKQIPIIMLTALDKSKDIIKGLSAGANDYVTKPFKFPELLARVKSHLRSKELYDIVKKEEQEKSAILDISRSLASTIEPHEILSTIVSKVAEVIEVRRCSITYIDRSNQKGFVVASDDSKEIKNLRINLNKYPEIQKIMETGKPVIINDVRNDPILFSVRDILSLTDIKSILGFPIIFKDATIGTLIISTYRREKPFNDREIRLCKVISNLAAAPLKNAYLLELLQKEKKREQEFRIAAEEELKDSKHFFQTVLQSMGEGIVVLDSEFRIQMANRFLLKILKREEKEAIGEYCYRLIFEREDRCPDCAVAETFQTGKPALTYHDCREKDGSSKYIELSSYPIFNDNGHVIQVIERVVDITQRKRIEMELENKTELVHLFQEIAIATSEASTFDEAMQICIDKVCLHTGWDIGHVYLPDSKGNLFSTKLWFFRDIDRFETFRKITEKTIFDPGVGLIGKVSGKGKPLWIEDVTREPYFLRTKSAKDINVKFGFAFPVIVSKKTVAVLEFFAEKSIKPDKALLEAISTLSTHLGRVYERKQAEEEKEKMQVQLLHSQKMEVIGQLAGGIAHEFNNILMAITGYSEIIQREINKNNPLRIKVNQILSLTKRATDFTRNLLVFSRKNIINPKVVKLNEIVKNVKKLLSNLLSEEIEIITKLSRKNLFIKADINQIEQVLMNLAMNSRDAMPAGGRILIKTGLKEINEKFIKKQSYGKCGKYAFLRFTDTGSGMDKKTMEKAFEPFFTTKDTGKGTGLGLSIVYGAIKQHKGFINIKSRLGEGTTFEMYFPLMQPNDMGNIKNKVIPFEGGGTETILIAEDDKAIREMIQDELVKFGYSVIEAVDGEDAVKVFKKNKEKIQLLLFDIIMPKKNGRKAYEEINNEKPGIKHIFMSGYSKDMLGSRGIDSEKINYIFKPISIFELLRTVRDVLDK